MNIIQHNELKNNLKKIPKIAVLNKKNVAFEACASVCPHKVVFIRSCLTESLLLVCDIGVVSEVGSTTLGL